MSLVKLFWNLLQCIKCMYVLNVFYHNLMSKLSFFDTGHMASNDINYGNMCFKRTTSLKLSDPCPLEPLHRNKL